MTTEPEIKSWIGGYPRQWDQLCQALMWQLANRFGTVVSTPQSAIQAYNIEANAGRIQGGAPPNGAFFYYAIGQYGHVGFEMDNGHGFMATKALIEEWTRDDAGWNTYDGYAAAKGARYLGWSWQNGGNTVPYTASGGAGGAVKYDWYALTPEAQLACQQMLNRLKLYGGADDPNGGTGPEDSEFGERSVKGMQEFFKRKGWLAADYVVDGIPHNPDLEAPSNYGYACQDWAITVGYDGKRDGLPAGYTSQFMVTAAAKEGVTPTPPDPKPPVVTVPDMPPAPEGYEFVPDLGSSQGDFDFAEYVSKGGTDYAVKMGGGNASDSPYVAPRYVDQMSRARSAGIHRAIQYWFNGDKNGLTPEDCADFYAANAMISEGPTVDGKATPGDVAAIDIETEMNQDGTVWQREWTVDEAVRYVKRLQTHFKGIRGLFYLSKSVYDAHDWSPLESLGWMPWIASWGDNDGDPNTWPEPKPIMWQYTSNETVPGGYSGNPKTYYRVDGNFARLDLFDVLGWVAPEPDPEPEPEPEPDNELEERVAALEAVVAGLSAAMEEFGKSIAVAGDVLAQAVEDLADQD